MSRERGAVGVEKEGQILEEATSSQNTFTRTKVGLTGKKNKRPLEATKANPR